MLRFLPTTVEYLKVVQSLIANVLHIVPWLKNRERGFEQPALCDVRSYHSQQERILCHRACDVLLSA